MSTRAPKDTSNTDNAGEATAVAEAAEASEPARRPSRPRRSRPATAAAAPRDPDLVTIPLAHFTRIDGKERKPGEKVTVTRDMARSLINQGAVAVNPADHRAVAKLLAGASEQAG